MVRPTARLLALLEILQAGGTHTAADLANRLDVDERTVRRYVDDVSFQVGKQSRDMLRHVQRDLRDHFMARSDELVRSAQELSAFGERAGAVGAALAARRGGLW